MGAGQIESVDVGRVVLRGKNGEIVVATGEELERLWIVSAPQYVLREKDTGKQVGIMQDEDLVLAQGRGEIRAGVEAIRPDAL